MARTLQDDDLRKERIEIIGNLFIFTGYSYRKLSKYITEHYFNISYVTVKDYIERYIKMNPDKCEEVNEIIKENTVANFKTDENIRQRIYKEAALIESGISLDEIASSMLISASVVSRDMSLRLAVLDPERSEKVLKILRENSANNLSDFRQK